MIIQLDHVAQVIDPGDGTLVVTRLSIMGKIASHTIQSCYSAEEVAHWMEERLRGKRTNMVQDAFPDMKDEDREFLLTGITPKAWAEMFPKEEGQ